MFPKDYVTVMTPKIVIRFSDFTEGVVIASESSSYPTGKASTTWVTCTDTRTWTPVVSKRQKLHTMVKDFK